MGRPGDRRPADLCRGITEPDAGSDVAAITTRVVRDGHEYAINGAKTYITNGQRAHGIVLVAKTDPAAGHPRLHALPPAWRFAGVDHPVREISMAKLHARGSRSRSPTSASRSTAAPARCASTGSSASGATCA